MSRGFPLQDIGPGMSDSFHDLAVEQEEERAKNHELTDADFCTLCGVCLPLADRCAGDNFKGSICPHAEANATQVDL